MKRLAISILALLLVQAALAQAVRLATVFSDGAVLQRDQPLPVWGSARSGERITVSFKGENVVAEADAAGRWMVVLQPKAASAEPAVLLAEGENSRQQAANVLVGDVWLCAGQSNMEMALRKTRNRTQYIDDPQMPLVRHFKVARAVAETPLADIAGQWQVASAETVEEFSAVAYLFGKRLYEETGVPVGLVNASWGGSVIEGWLDVEALRGAEFADKVINRWQEHLAELPQKTEAWKRDYDAWKKQSERAKDAGESFSIASPRRPEARGGKSTPGGLYKGMIQPLTSMALRGVIWYQGESNAIRHSEYADLFAALITQWRLAFVEPELPFYFVQLPAYNLKEDASQMRWAWLRQAQQAALALADTGMVVTIDLGQENYIHPRDKQALAFRLADLALARSYGHNIAVDVPLFERAEYGADKIRIYFNNASGLHCPSGIVAGVEVAGEDRVFVPAVAEVEGNTLLVRSPNGVKQPVAVRYAWSNAPAASLFNAAGMPVAPFRTDSWPAGE